MRPTREEELRSLTVLILLVITGLLPIWILGGNTKNPPHVRTVKGRLDSIVEYLKIGLLVYFAMIIIWGKVNKSLLLEMKQDPVVRALLSQELLSEKYLNDRVMDFSGLTTFFCLCIMSTLLRFSLPYLKEQVAYFKENGINIMLDRIEQEYNRMERSFVDTLDDIGRRWINIMEEGYLQLTQKRNVVIGYNNEQKLENIGFTGDIPQEFICSISYNIMTHPVYDANFPKGCRFEYSFIIQELTLRHKNPYTTTSLDSNGLLTDSKLKDEIDAFVQQKLSFHDEEMEQQNSKPTFF